MEIDEIAQRHVYKSEEEGQRSELWTKSISKGLKYVVFHATFLTTFHKEEWVFWILFEKHRKKNFVKISENKCFTQESSSDSNFRFFIFANTKQRATKLLIIFGSKSVLTDKPNSVWCNSQNSYEFYSQEHNYFGKWWIDLPVSREIRSCLCCSFVFIPCSI